VKDGTVRAREPALSGTARASVRFRALALLTTIVTYLEIVLGGTVRATGSGEACPDWPTCHGHLVPAFDAHVLIEYSHRLTASLVAILIVLLALAAYWFWRQPRYRRTLAGLAVALLALQVALGGVTVLADLPPEVVAAHLATATALLGALTILTVYTFRGRPPVTTIRARRFARAVMLPAAATFIVIISGSYVVGADADLACHTWPLCNGQVAPTGGIAAVDINFLHRLLVLLLGICLAGVVAMAWRARATRPAVFWPAVAALLLYVGQIFIGAGNVWTGLAAGVQVAHLAAAEGIWVITSALIVLSVGDVAAPAPRVEAAPRRRLPAAPAAGRRPRFGDRVRSERAPGSDAS
jgi:heme A synthase